MAAMAADIWSTIESGRERRLRLKCERLYGLQFSRPDDEPVPESVAAQREAESDLAEGAEASAEPSAQSVEAHPTQQTSEPDHQADQVHLPTTTCEEDASKAGEHSDEHSNYIAITTDPTTESCTTSPEPTEATLKQINQNQLTDALHEGKVTQFENIQPQPEVRCSLLGDKTEDNATESDQVTYVDAGASSLSSIPFEPPELFLGEIDFQEEVATTEHSHAMSKSDIQPKPCISITDDTHKVVEDIHIEQSREDRDIDVLTDELLPSNSEDNNAQKLSQDDDTESKECEIRSMESNKNNSETPTENVPATDKLTENFTQKRFSFNLGESIAEVTSQQIQSNETEHTTETNHKDTENEFVDKMQVKQEVETSNAATVESMQPNTNKQPKKKRKSKRDKDVLVISGKDEDEGISAASENKLPQKAKQKRKKGKRKSESEPYLAAEDTEVGVPSNNKDPSGFEPLSTSHNMNVAEGKLQSLKMLELSHKGVEKTDTNEMNGNRATSSMSSETTELKEEWTMVESKKEKRKQKRSKRKSESGGKLSDSESVREGERSTEGADVPTIIRSETTVPISTNINDFDKDARELTHVDSISTNNVASLSQTKGASDQNIVESNSKDGETETIVATAHTSETYGNISVNTLSMAASSAEVALADGSQEIFVQKESNSKTQVDKRPDTRQTETEIAGDCLNVLEACDILLSSSNNLGKGLVETDQLSDAKESGETHIIKSITDQPSQNGTATKLDELAADTRESLLISKVEHIAPTVHQHEEGKPQPSKENINFTKTVNDTQILDPQLKIEDDENSTKKYRQEIQCMETHWGMSETKTQAPENTEDSFKTLDAFDILLSPDDGLCKGFLDSFEDNDRIMITDTHGETYRPDCVHKKVIAATSDIAANTYHEVLPGTSRDTSNIADIEPEIYSQLTPSKDSIGPNEPTQIAEELIKQTTADVTFSENIPPPEDDTTKVHHEIPVANNNQTLKNMDAFDILLSSGDDLCEGFLDSFEPYTNTTEDNTRIINDVTDKQPDKNTTKKHIFGICESNEIELPGICNEQSRETEHSSTEASTNKNEPILEPMTEDNKSKAGKSSQKLTHTEADCNSPGTKAHTEALEVMDAFDILLSSGDDFYQGLVDSLESDTTNFEPDTQLIHSMPHEGPQEVNVSKAANFANIDLEDKNVEVDESNVLLSNTTNFTQLDSMEASTYTPNISAEATAAENTCKAMEANKTIETNSLGVNAASMSSKDKMAPTYTVDILSSVTPEAESLQENVVPEENIANLHVQETFKYCPEQDKFIMEELQKQNADFTESTRIEKEMSQKRPEISEHVDAFDLLLSSGDNLQEGFLESFETQDENTLEASCAQPKSKQMEDNTSNQEVSGKKPSVDESIISQYDGKLSGTTAKKRPEACTSHQLEKQIWFDKAEYDAAETEYYKKLYKQSNHEDKVSEKSNREVTRINDNTVTVVTVNQPQINTTAVHTHAKADSGSAKMKYPSEHSLQNVKSVGAVTSQPCVTKKSITKPCTSRLPEEKPWYDKAIYDAAETEYYKNLYGQSKPDSDISQECHKVILQSNHEALNAVVTGNPSEINEKVIQTKTDANSVNAEMECPSKHLQEIITFSAPVTNQSSVSTSTLSLGLPGRAFSNFPDLWFDKFTHDTAEMQHYEQLGRKSRGDQQRQEAGECREGSVSGSDSSSSYPLYEGSCDHFHDKDGQTTSDEEFAPCEEDVFQDATWTENKLYQIVPDVDSVNSGVPLSPTLQPQVTNTTTTTSLKLDTTPLQSLPVSENPDNSHIILSTPTTTNAHLTADTPLSADTGISVDTELPCSAGSMSGQSTVSSAVSPRSPRLDLDDVYFEDVVLAGRQSDVTMAALPGFTAAPHSEGLAPGEQLDSLNTEPDLELSEPGTADILESEGGAQPFPYDGGSDGGPMMTPTMTSPVGDTEEERDTSETSSVTAKTTTERMVSPMSDTQLPRVSLDSCVTPPVLADGLPSPVFEDRLPSPALRSDMPSPTLRSDMPAVSLRSDVSPPRLSRDIPVPQLAVDIPTLELPTVVLGPQTTDADTAASSDSAAVRLTTTLEALEMVRALHLSARLQTGELVKPTSPEETVAPTDVIETQLSTSAVEAAAPTQTIEVPGFTPSTEAHTQATEAPKLASAIKAPEPTQPIEAPESTQAIEASPPIQAIEAPAPTQAIGAPTPIHAIKAPELTQAIEASAPTQAIEAPELTPAIEAPAPIHAIKASPPIQAIEAPVPTQAMEEPKPTPAKDMPVSALTVVDPALVLAVASAAVSAENGRVVASTTPHDMNSEEDTGLTKNASDFPGEKTNDNIDTHLNKEVLSEREIEFGNTSHSKYIDNEKLVDKTNINTNIYMAEVKAPEVESDEEIINFTGQNTPHSPIITKKLKRKKRTKSGNTKIHQSWAEKKVTLEASDEQHNKAEPPSEKTEPVVDTTASPGTEAAADAATVVSRVEPIHEQASVALKDSDSASVEAQEPSQMDDVTVLGTKASKKNQQRAENQAQSVTLPEETKSDKQILTEKLSMEQSSTEKESLQASEKINTQDKQKPKFAQSSQVSPPSPTAQPAGRAAAGPSGARWAAAGGVSGVPLRSQPALPDRTLFLAGEEGRTYAALLQQGADMQPARAVFTAHACHVCKRLHSRQHRLKSCGSCRLVAYCSAEHQRAHWPLHRALCRVVTRRLRHLGTDHIYREALNVTSAEQWKRIRFKHMAVCEEMLDRPMEAYEKEMFLYPRACDTCHETSPERLHTCTACHSVSFCSEQHLRSNHAKFCKDLRLLFDVHSHQNRHGVCAPTLPADTVLSSYEPLPPHIREFLVVTMLGPQCAMQLSAVELAVMTEAASYPLTLLYALQNIPIAEEVHVSRLQEMTVHVVGAEWAADCEPLARWDVFLLNVLPRLRRLHVVFVGLELETAGNGNSSGSGEDLACSPCRAAGKRFTCEFHPNTEYHTYCGSAQFRPPNVVCAFNAGLHRRAGQETRDTWRDSLPQLTQDGVPLVLTGLTMLECPQDVALLQRRQRLDVLLPPRKNPYRSTRPGQNFLSEHEAPVVFKNQYVACVMAAAKQRK